MSKESDINRFVKEPSLLIDLCCDVIEQLDAVSDVAEPQEKEAQLREISRTIDRLDKGGIAVPEALRAEKTRLAAALSVHTEVSQALNLLAEGFDEILKNLKTRLNREKSKLAPRKVHSKRSTSPKTGRKILREHIIRALKILGGRAQSADVVEQIGRQLEGKLLPGDMEWRKSVNSYAWQHNVHWERYRMTQDGVLRSDSERGNWELNEGCR